MFEAGNRPIFASVGGLRTAFEASGIFYSFVAQTSSVILTFRIPGIHLLLQKLLLPCSNSGNELYLLRNNWFPAHLQATYTSCWLTRVLVEFLSVLGIITLKNIKHDQRHGKIIMSDQGSMSGCSGPCPASPQLQLYQTIIFATPVLFAFLLLVLFCLLYIRRRRNAALSSQARLQFMSRGLFPTPAYDHGLSKSFRQRLPTIPFDEKFAASNEDNQCAVCLCDYEMHEKLQQLPVCKHAFHVLCIDEWLAKNTTCPICRTSLLQGGSNASVMSLRGEDTRRWEERVVNEVQDGPAHMRTDVSNEAGSSIVDAPSIGVAPPRFSTDHAINIERS